MANRKFITASVYRKECPFVMMSKEILYSKELSPLAKVIYGILVDQEDTVNKLCNVNMSKPRILNPPIKGDSTYKGSLS